MELREFEVSEQDYIPKRKFSVPANWKSVLVIALLCLSCVLAIASLALCAGGNKRVDSKMLQIDSQMLKIFHSLQRGAGDTTEDTIVVKYDEEKLNKTNQMEILLEYIRNNSRLQNTNLEKVLATLKDNSDTLESLESRIDLLGETTKLLQHNVSLLHNATNKACRQPTTPGNLSMTNLGSRWYFFSDTERRSWHNAKNFCISQGLQLLSIETPEEDDLIKRNRQFSEGDVWTGGYTNGNYQLKWIGTGKNIIYMRERISPDVTKCVELRNNNVWSMYLCSVLQRFICEYEGETC